MTVTHARSPKARAIRKLALGAALGAVVGAVSAILFIELVAKPSRDFDDAGAVLSAMVGLIYAIIGVFVGLGALAPRQGALFLNVEDADEIREQRANLGPSAIACILIGMFLILLALAGSFEGIHQQLAAVTALACLAAVVAISLATRRSADELMREIGREASAFTLNVGIVVLSLWTVIEHLGYTGWVGPLELVAGLALLQLVAIFWVSWKRGLMKPR